jgi:hypothetical protein
LEFFRFHDEVSAKLEIDLTNASAMVDDFSKIKFDNIYLVLQCNNLQSYKELAQQK